MRHKHRSFLHRRRVVAYIGLLLVTLFTCLSAYADAPITRGEPAQAKGSMSAADHAWSGVQALPPLVGETTATSTSRQAWSQDVPEPGRPYSATQDTASTAWLSRTLNPGNWIVDAGLGIGTSMFMTFIEIGISVANQLIGTDGCLGVAFCTPADTLFGSSGIVSLSLASVWNRLQPAAFLLITLLATVRVGQILYENPGGAAQGFQDLLWAYVFSMLFAVGCGWMLYNLVEFFNAINAAILGQQDLQVLKSLLTPTPLSFGPSITRFIMFIFLIAVIVMGYVRLLKIFVLATISPLMGATLMNRATASYFWSWGSAIITLLLEQTAWAVSFSIGLIIVFPRGLPDLSTPFGNIYGSIGMTIALILAMMSRSTFKQIFDISPIGGGTLRNTAKQAVGWAAHGAMVGSRSRGSVGGTVATAAMRGGLFGGPVGAVGSGAGALVGAGFRKPPSRPTRSAATTAGGNPPRRPQRPPSPQSGTTNQTAGPRAATLSVGATSTAGQPSPRPGSSISIVGQNTLQQSSGAAVGPTVRLPSIAQSGTANPYTTVRLPNIAQPGAAHPFATRRLPNAAQQPTMVANNPSHTRGSLTAQAPRAAGSAVRLPKMTQGAASKSYTTVRLPDLAQPGNTSASSGSKRPRTTTYGGDEIRLKPVGQRPRTWEPSPARVPGHRNDLRKPHVVKKRGVPAPGQMHRSAERAMQTRPHVARATTRQSSEES